MTIRDGDRLAALVGPVTYAVGDLHGEVTLLHGLLATLPLRDEDTIVFIRRLPGPG